MQTALNWCYRCVHTGMNFWLVGRPPTWPVFTDARYTLPVFTGRVGKKHCTTMLFRHGPWTRPVFTGAGTHYPCLRAVNTGTKKHTRVHGVEFYFYPTASTALIHSVKPKLTTISNSENVQTELYLACMVIIRRIVTYKIFINKQLKHTNVTIRLALYVY